MFSSMARYGLLSLAIIAALAISSHAGDAGHARKLINSQGCKACHALEGDGGSAAASFEAMRQQLTRIEIRQHLVTFDQTHGNGKIGDFSHLSEAELEALVDFILPSQGQP